jgi:hypothetical protein
MKRAAPGRLLDQARSDLQSLIFEVESDLTPMRPPAVSGPSAPPWPTPIRIIGSATPVR